MMWRGFVVAAVVALTGLVALGRVHGALQAQAVIPVAADDPTEEAAVATDPPDEIDEPLRLILPTSNDALLHDDGPTFYQYTDRFFEGRRSRPWQGGKYGFVRNPRRSGGELIYTRFHEGVDIRPLYRDRNGEPLDTVRSIDRGTVVYVNNGAGASSYGRYVVVEHWWSGAPFYSLYAHLGRIEVREGQEVEQGDALGRIGYTGRGINRRRAHVHFEINMLLNSDFDAWYASEYRGSRNAHGIFNGINLAGLDVPSLYRSLRQNPDLTIEEFITGKEAFFAVIVPNTGLPDLLVRYPWLLDDDAPASDEAPSWEIAFTASGFPSRVRRANRAVDAPIVSMVKEVPHDYGHLTIGRLEGSGPFVTLTPRGRRYLSMLLSPDREPDFQATN